MYRRSNELTDKRTNRQMDRRTDGEENDGEMKLIRLEEKSMTVTAKNVHKVLMQRSVFFVLIFFFLNTYVNT